MCSSCGETLKAKVRGIENDLCMCACFSGWCWGRCSDVMCLFEWLVLGWV